MPRPIIRLLAVVSLLAAVLAVPGASAADVPSSVCVVALGDSITADPSGGPAFRDQLAFRLTVEARVPATVVNEGHNGYTLQSLLDGVDGWLSTDKSTCVAAGGSGVSVVLVNAGTNDARGAAGAPIGLAVGRLDRLVERVHVDLPGVPVVLSKLQLSGPAWTNANEIELNSNLPAVAARWPGTYLADMSPIASDYTVDGYHPSVVGYSMYGYLLYVGLRAGPWSWLPPAPDNPMVGALPVHRFGATGWGWLS
jgi:lysophospholipase L1-like esterase